MKLFPLILVFVSAAVTYGELLTPKSQRLDPWL